MSKQMSDLILENYAQLDSWYGERHDNIVPLSRRSSASAEHDLISLLKILKPGRVMNLSGYPNHQQLAMCAAYHIAMKNYGMTVIVWAPDKAANEVSMQLLSFASQVEMNFLRVGAIESEEWRKLASAAGVLAESNIHILDENSSFESLEKKCSTVRCKSDCLAAIVAISNDKSIVTNLEALARKLNVPVIIINGTYDGIFVD